MRIITSRDKLRAADLRQLAREVHSRGASGRGVTCTTAGTVVAPPPRRSETYRGPFAVSACPDSDGARLGLLVRHGYVTAGGAALNVVEYEAGSPYEVAEDTKGDPLASGAYVVGLRIAVAPESGGFDDTYYAEPGLLPRDSSPPTIHPTQSAYWTPTLVDVPCVWWPLADCELVARGDTLAIYGVEQRWQGGDIHVPTWYFAQTSTADYPTHFEAVAWKIHTGGSTYRSDLDLVIPDGVPFLGGA